MTGCGVSYEAIGSSVGKGRGACGMEQAGDPAERERQSREAGGHGAWS